MNAHINWFSVIGLAFDIIGAFLIYHFGLPSKWKEPSDLFLVFSDGAWQMTEEQRRPILDKNEKIKTGAKWGIGLLIVGFLGQLAAALFKNPF